MKARNLVFATLLAALGSAWAVQSQSYPSYPPPPPPTGGNGNYGAPQQPPYDPQGGYDNQGYNNQGYDNQGYDNQAPYYDPQPDSAYQDQGSYNDPGAYDQGSYDAGQGPVDESVFYGELSPYGRWIQRSGYGWVWEPTRVAVGWRPYTLGHWVDTDYGWTWISQEPWGWATYHYGRWLLDQEYGWLWVPGTEWGPAWVSFQQGGGYVGWAPLPPSVGFQAGIGIQIGGLSLSASIDPYAYSFVPERSFLDERLPSVILPPARNVTFIRSTNNITNIRVVNNRVVNQSLDPRRVEQVTGQPVRRYQLQEVRNPAQGRVARIQGNQISLFRPATTLRQPRADMTPPVALQQRQQRLQQRQPGQQPQPGQPSRGQQPRLQTGQQPQPGQPAPNAPRALAPADLERKHQAEQQQLQSRQEAERNRLQQMHQSESQAQGTAAAVAAQHQAEQRALQQQQQREQQMLQARHQREQQAAQARPQQQNQNQQQRREDRQQQRERKPAPPPPPPV
ncbi:MAG TPA: DUF6600 domain-containing protein [Thermoanaerobaculia bacterium]|jgi:hypothetical protein